MLPLTRSQGSGRFSRAWAMVAALAVLPLAGATGCALVLGFEDTALRSGAETDGGPEGDASPDEDGGGVAPVDGSASRLSVTPTTLVLHRGGSVDLTVTVERGSDLTGVITARLTTVPTGVTATTATLAAGVSTATLTLTATASAPVGAKSITLTAEGTSLPPLQIPLLVAQASGALDATLLGAGFLTDPSRGNGSTFFALALYPDQRSAAGGAAGATPGSLNGWLVRRYATNGVPDTAFNTAAAAAGVSPTDGELHALAIDAKGNTVCVGFSQPPPQQLTIMRLLPTGALDASFAGGIVRIAPEAPGSSSFGYGVAVEPSGAIVVVGSRKDLLGMNEAGIIARFKENGTRDAAFNGGNTVVVPGTRLVGVAVDGAGIVAGGSTLVGALPSYVLTRRTAAGAADATFGSGGTAAFGNTYRANAFARRADGTFAVVGDVQSGTAGYTAGVTSAKGNAVFARAYANLPGAGFFGIGVQTDGLVVAAGHTSVANGEARIERILSDGNKDTTFGTAGTVIIQKGGAGAFDVTLFAAALQTDGRILAAGNRSNAGGVVYRLWP